MPAATFPVGGTVQNYDYDVGHDGIIGVKTGSDAAALGCWAFAATRSVAGTTQTVYGVVLGIPAHAQQGSSSRRWPPARRWPTWSREPSRR